MKKSGVVLIAGIFLLTSLQAEAGVETRTSLEGFPKVIVPVDTNGSINLDDPDELLPCRYPQFERNIPPSDPNGEMCEQVLREPTRVSLQPWPRTPAQISCGLTAPGRFSDMGAMRLNIKVGATYQRTASVLITWTVRVQAQGDPVTVGGGVILYENSSPYSLTACNNVASAWTPPLQSFPGGVVAFRLGTTASDAMTSAARNNFTKISRLTLPTAGGGASEAARLIEPTISGSVIIRPGDFSAEQFPLDFDVFLTWANETCQHIITPANGRSMMAVMLPQGDQ